MRAASRIPYWLVLAGLVATLGLIGWVTRTTSADNIRTRPSIPTQVVTPHLVPAPTAHDVLELAQAPADFALAQALPAESKPPTPVPVPVPAQALPAESKPPTATTEIEGALNPPPTQPGIESLPMIATPDPSPADAEPRPISTKPMAFKPTVMASKPVPIARDSSAPSATTENDDPAKAVESFVDQNQKVAETQLKALRAEEARLRARLQKVELGIKRWEAVVQALRTSTHVNSDVQPSFVRPHLPPADSPESLDAIPKYKIGPPPAATRGN